MIYAFFKIAFRIPLAIQQKLTCRNLHSSSASPIKQYAVLPILLNCEFKPSLIFRYTQQKVERKERTNLKWT